MGFRFRQSLTILIGVRLNLSNGTPGLSMGLNRASISFGRRDTYASLRLRGTGLSCRTRLNRAARSAGQSRNINDSGLRQALELEADELMSIVAAIRNIHALTPNPKTGMSWSELESVYLQSRMAPFQVPEPVRPTKPEYMTLPEKPGDSEGVSFLSKWFESDSVKSERYAENNHRWQQELIDTERENTLRQLKYQ